MAQILCLFGACEVVCSANAGLDIYADMRVPTRMQICNLIQIRLGSMLYLLTVQYALWNCHGIQINYSRYYFILKRACLVCGLFKCRMNTLEWILLIQTDT